MPTGVQRLPTNYAALLGSSGNFTVSLGSTTGGDLYNFAHRTLTDQADTVADDSDKTITVPAGRLWWIHAIRVTLVTTATVGNRVMEIRVTSSPSVIPLIVQAGAVQIANRTVHYNFIPGVVRETSIATDTLMVPIPPRLLIPAAGSIRLFDNNAIAAAADDMDFALIYDEITV